MRESWLRLQINFFSLAELNLNVQRQPCNVHVIETEKDEAKVSVGVSA